MHSAWRPVRRGPGRHPHLRQYREDAGALHFLARIRRSAVVRVRIPPGTGNRPADRVVAPEPCAVRPLPDSRAVIAGARPVRLLARSGHRPGIAPVDSELGQHREPAQRDEVGSRRVRQRGCGPGRRGRRRTDNGRRMRVDRKPLRHPRGAGAGEGVARRRICAELRVVGVAKTNDAPCRSVKGTSPAMSKFTECGHLENRTDLQGATDHPVDQSRGQGPGNGLQVAHPRLKASTADRLNAHVLV